MNCIEIDLSNLKASREIMDKYGDEPFPFIGKNECGETTRTSISHESIVVETYQDNGWIRQNWLYYDGSREEMINGRWNYGKNTYTVTLEIQADSREEVMKMIDKVIDSKHCLSYEI